MARASTTPNARRPDRLTRSWCRIPRMSCAGGRGEQPHRASRTGPTMDGARTHHCRTMIPMPNRPSPRRAVSLLLTVSLLAASAMTPHAVTAAPSKVRLVLTLSPGTSHAHADDVAKVPGGRVVGRIDQLGVRVVEVPAAAVANARSRWAHMAEVLRVEADGLLSADWTPPDPMWGNQLEHRLVRAPKAWDLERGDRSTIVAVVDTGVQLKHPDL